MKKLLIILILGIVVSCSVKHKCSNNSDTFNVNYEYDSTFEGNRL